MSDSSSSSSGIGLFGMTFIVFLVLKLTGHITWSWWWVTAPLWGGFIVWTVVAAVLFGIVYHLEKREFEAKYRRRR